jgi:Asp-tRNA(Asn)/Glu-tRNA(Gln) amidotransferase A subunit family amidase
MTLVTAGPLSRTPTSSVELLELLLERIAALEARVQAFAWIDVGRARRLAAAADEAATHTTHGRLHGLPLGVKDVFDTAGIPTACGTCLLAGRIPSRSASAVTALERAGAFVLGKTVTAELAFAAPGPTRNPWNVERTPGGSSMGSAAGVAAGMLPAATGTQTNSSIIMPASLCGVVGFKPTAGSIRTDGVLEFSRTLDQPGTFARTVDDAAVIAAAMAGDPSPEPPPGRKQPPAIGVADMPETSQAASAVQSNVNRAVELLRHAGASIEHVPLPQPLHDARATHRTIMAREAATALGPLIARDPDAVSLVLRRFLAEGAATTDRAYQEALTRRNRIADVVDRLARPFDALICPAAPDEAPMAETTGDPRFCTLWTLAGAPAIAIPNGRGPAGLPIGLQLVGRRGDDARLLATASWVEATLVDEQER